MISCRGLSVQLFKCCLQRYLALSVNLYCRSWLTCLKYSTAPINVSLVVKVVVESHYYYSHYYTSSKCRGQTWDVVSLTVALAKRRLTKTGRLNNTFITFWEAGGQVHVKSITSKVSSAQLISPHARHTLLEICVEDVLILLVLPFSQAPKQSGGITRSPTKQPPPPSSPIKQNNKLTTWKNNPSSLCVCV